jgi:hypothetical protein
MNASPIPPAGFYQVAYVTSDFERALETCGATHGIRAWARLPQMRYPTLPGREAICDVALARVGATEIEIIQPCSGDIALYRDWLPPSGFALRLHHLGRRYDSLEALELQVAAYQREGRLLPVNADSPGSARYYYADYRAELGHYIEGICFEPAALPWLESIPRN